MSRLLKRLRNYLAMGLIVLLPLVATVYIVVTVFRFVDGLLLNLLAPFGWKFVTGTGFLVTVAVIFLAGMLTSGIVGRTVVGWGEALFRRLPFVRTIYGGAKQMAETVFLESRRSFRQLALVEYPRKGCWSMGFVTHEAATLLDDSSYEGMVTVFVPSTPIPTTGFTIMVPKADVKVLSNLSVEDGIKVIISGGVLGVRDRG